MFLGNYFLMYLPKKIRFKKLKNEIKKINGFLTAWVWSLDGDMKYYYSTIFHSQQSSIYNILYIVITFTYSSILHCIESVFQQ